MVLKLYDYEESGNCYKVRLLAALLDIELEVYALDYDNDEHLEPAFLAISPRAEIPALVDTAHSRTFTDSAAILTYLASTYPDPGSTTPSTSSVLPSSFWSADGTEQATIVDWLAFASTWVQPGVCRARALFHFSGPPSTSEVAKARRAVRMEDATTRGLKSLKILNEHLEKNEWLAIGRPTIADVAVFPYVALAPMGDIKLEPFPHVLRWIASVKALPRFVTMPGLDDPNYRKRDME